MTRASKKPVKPALEGPLEELDRQILMALKADARLTLNELSARLPLSVTACWARIKRLEERGIIIGYAVLLNRNAFKLSNVVFVEVRLSSNDAEAILRFGEAVAQLPEVLEVHAVAGEWDCLLKVLVSGVAQLELFVREKLQQTAGFQHSRSMFVLSSLKEDPSVDPAYF